jgi:hypothetical protein
MPNIKVEERAAFHHEDGVIIFFKNVGKLPPYSITYQNSESIVFTAVRLEILTNVKKILVRILIFEQRT